MIEHSVGIIVATLLGIFITGFIVGLIIKPSHALLFAWIWFNLFIALYETYVFIKRKELEAKKMDCNKTNFWKEPVSDSFWLDAWAEYACVADERYFNPLDFVYWIEIGNAVLVVLMLFTAVLGWTNALYVLVALQAYHCFMYFATFVHEKRNHISTFWKDAELKSSIYLGISALWIIIPVFILVAKN
jgi:uncharacterized membrane protein YuzA (DUF378 family)